VFDIIKNIWVYLGCRNFKNEVLRVRIKNPQFMNLIWQIEKESALKVRSS